MVRISKDDLRDRSREIKAALNKFVDEALCAAAKLESAHRKNARLNTRLGKTDDGDAALILELQDALQLERNKRESAEAKLRRFGETNPLRDALTTTLLQCEEAMQALDDVDPDLHDYLRRQWAAGKVLRVTAKNRQRRERRRAKPTEVPR